MRYKPPDGQTVTGKSFQNQLGNKITGFGNLLLPILLLVFPIGISQVTKGNENRLISTPLTNMLKCTVLHFFSKFVRGCLIYFRYFVTFKNKYLYIEGKRGNKRGNKIGNKIDSVTPWLY